MTARDVFWVAGELAGADFVHPAAGDALDGKTSGSQLSHKFRMRAERHDVVTFHWLLPQRKPLPPWKRFTDHFAKRRPLLLRRFPFRAKLNAS